MQIQRPYQHSALSRLNFYFPVVFLIMVLIEFLWFPKLLWNKHETINFIQNIIFVNSVHVIFSYLIIFFTVEGRQWRSEIVRTTPLIWHRFLFVFVSFLFLWGAYVYFSPNEYGQIAFFFLLIMPKYHETAQSKGILFCLLRIKGLSSENLHFATRVLNPLFISYFLIGTFLSARLLFPRFVNLSYINLSHFLLGLIFINVLSIYLFLFRALRKVDSDVFLFCLRFVVDLFIPISAIASFGPGSIHGIEYAHVASNLKNKQLKIGFKLILACVFLVLTWTIMRYPFYLFTDVFNQDSNKLFGAAMMGVVAGFTFGHYFLDHFMFSARYKPSKEIFLARVL